MSRETTPYSPIQSGRLYELIVAQIEGRILAGELQPGDRLPAERDLAEQFGVSRTAVREAVKTLIQQGLVEVYPGRGTFVTDSTSHALRHSLGLMLSLGPVDGTQNLVEVREMLEPELAALAAKRASDPQIRTLQQMYDRMDASMDDIDAFMDADMEFHMTIARATQNELTPVLVEVLVGLIREHRRMVAIAEGGLERALAHHHNILQAICRKNPEAARLAMQAHLKQVRDDSDTGKTLSKNKET